MVAGIVPAHHKEKEIQSQGFIVFSCNMQGRKLYVPVGNEPVTLGGSEESNIMLYTSCKIGKIHARVFRLEKDGDLYISPANEYCRMYVNHKEIKGPTLLSHKTEIEIGSQYLKFEEKPVMKVGEPLAGASEIFFKRNPDGFFKPKPDPRKMTTPQATEVIKFEENHMVKEDEPLKTTSDEISSTVSINETTDICNDTQKVTEVIESKPEDHNENATPIPDNNDKNENRI